MVIYGGAGVAEAGSWGVMAVSGGARAVGVGPEGRGRAFAPSGASEAGTGASFGGEGERRCFRDRVSWQGEPAIRGAMAVPGGHRAVLLGEGVGQKPSAPCGSAGKGGYAGWPGCAGWDGRLYGSSGAQEGFPRCGWSWGGGPAPAWARWLCDAVPGRGGAALGGRLGSGVGRPLGVAAIPVGGVAGAPGSMGQWGRVAGFGGGGGLGGADGGGGVGVGGGGGGSGGVVMVVVVFWVVAVLVVVVVVVVVVLGPVVMACLQDSLVPRWDKGLGHHLQPMRQQGLVDSWGGFGLGFEGDRGPGVPFPRVGLAGVGGCLWGRDGRALEDGDVDEGFDGVVLRGRFRGGGLCWG